MDFAQVLMLAAHQVGEDNHGRNGLVGYLCRIARTEPKLFFRLFIAVALNWIGLKADERPPQDWPYETPEELYEALRAIGSRPQTLRDDADSWEEHESQQAAKGRSSSGKRKLKAQHLQGSMRSSQEDGAGRTQAAKNVSTLAEALIFAAQQVGEDNRGRNGVAGYLCRMARTEPKLFCSFLIGVMGSAVAKGDEKPGALVPYETVEEAEERMREVGLTPEGLRATADEWEKWERRRAATGENRSGRAGREEL
jgi:hypothetical protein